jgi:acyl carrier protein
MQTQVRERRGDMSTQITTDEAQATPPQPMNAEAIQEWLIAKVAEAVKCAPETIDVREPLASYGLSSVSAVSLTADIEDWLGLQLPPTLAWDYPTIESLAGFIESEVERNRESAA